MSSQQSREIVQHAWQAFATRDAERISAFFDEDAQWLALEAPSACLVHHGLPPTPELGYVVEQTFALLHQFTYLAVRWERRIELHDSFLSLACTLICWRRLKKTGS
ncbi:nuclear transport factor 2-like protein [Streptomyces avermitilis]|uniref:hypothetical protein n=1 Tax=Streptomyces avermitilis TaxID=33903 RepID=UPI0038058D1B